MNADRPIYLLTHSRDFYTVDNVQQALLDQGYQAIRIDTDLFPNRFSVTVDYQSDSLSHVLSANGQHLALDQAHAIWCRRLWPAAAPNSLSGREALRSRQESRHAFDDLLANLSPRVYCLDPSVAQRRANSKMHQLTQARALGLPVLPSLISNDVDRVKAFAKAHEGEIVSKSLSAYISDYGLAEDFVFTQHFADFSPQHFQKLRHTPLIFQQYIAKKKEFRVILLGELSFVGSQQPQSSQGLPVDWRLPEVADVAPWQRDHLPAPLLDKLKQLARRLGLQYGAVDLIEDHAGAFHFLEINPTGEYGWFERDLAYPISQHIAALLISRGMHADLNPNS